MILTIATANSSSSNLDAGQRDTNVKQPHVKDIIARMHICSHGKENHFPRIQPKAHLPTR